MRYVNPIMLSHTIPPKFGCYFGVHTTPEHAVEASSREALQQQHASRRSRAYRTPIEKYVRVLIRRRAALKTEVITTIHHLAYLLPIAAGIFDMCLEAPLPIDQGHLE